MMAPSSPCMQTVKRRLRFRSCRTTVVALSIVASLLWSGADTAENLEESGLVGNRHNLTATWNHWRVQVGAMDQRWHDLVRAQGGAGANTSATTNSTTKDAYTELVTELTSGGRKSVPSSGSTRCAHILSKAHVAERVRETGTTLTTALKAMATANGGGFAISARRPLRIAHVVNPVFERKNAAALDEITMITLASMAAARDFTHMHSGGLVEVELWLCNFHDEPKPAIEGFRYTRSLNRSVIDLAKAANMELVLTKSNPTPRRLPVANDILEAIHESSKADFVIYTNTDIGVMPYFYSFAGAWFAGGLDSMFVNRVPVPVEGRKYPTLPSIWDEVLKHPQNHGGWDCFGWNRKLFDRFRWRMEVAVVGAPPIGSKLKNAIMCYARFFFPVVGKHLTFHLGGTGSGDKHVHSGWAYARPWNFNYKKHWTSPVKPEGCSGMRGSAHKKPFHGVNFANDKDYVNQVRAVCTDYHMQPGKPISTEMRLVMLYAMSAANGFLP